MRAVGTLPLPQSTPAHLPCPLPAPQALRLYHLAWRLCSCLVYSRLLGRKRKTEGEL